MILSPSLPSTQTCRSSRACPVPSSCLVLLSGLCCRPRFLPHSPGEEILPLSPPSFPPALHLLPKSCFPVPGCSFPPWNLHAVSSLSWPRTCLQRIREQASQLAQGKHPMGKRGGRLEVLRVAYRFKVPRHLPDVHILYTVIRSSTHQPASKLTQALGEG